MRIHIKAGKARSVEYKGITFCSQTEFYRYVELEERLRKKEISNLRLQVPYELIPSQYVNGKCVERKCLYVADFVYYDKKRKQEVVEDAKGSKALITDVFKLKKKLMLQKYGIQVEVVFPKKPSSLKKRCRK